MFKKQTGSNNKKKKPNDKLQCSCEKNDSVSKVL